MVQARRPAILLFPVMFMIDFSVYFLGIFTSRYVGGPIITLCFVSKRYVKLRDAPFSLLWGNTACASAAPISWVSDQPPPPVGTALEAAMSTRLVQTE